MRGGAGWQGAPGEERQTSALAHHLSRPGAHQGELLGVLGVLVLVLGVPLVLSVLLHVP